MYKVTFLNVLLFLLSACVPQKSAQIEYNHDKAPISKSEAIDYKKDLAGKNQQITSKSILDEDKKYDDTSGILHEKKPIEIGESNQEEILPNAVLNSNQIIYHEVENNETIEDIAAKYDQTVAEIAEFNQLEAPYKLEEGQNIKVKKTKKLLTTANNLKDESFVKNSEFKKPLLGKIISNFGDQTASGTNKGINIAAQKGTKISSVSDGKITYSGFNPNFGNLVIVKVSNMDMEVAYAHMEGLIRKQGDEIRQGEAIGYVGATGEVDMPQLYLAMRKGKVSVDPAEYILLSR